MGESYNAFGRASFEGCRGTVSIVLGCGKPEARERSSSRPRRRARGLPLLGAVPRELHPEPGGHAHRRRRTARPRLSLPLPRGDAEPSLGAAPSGRRRPPLLHHAVAPGRARRADRSCRGIDRRGPPSLALLELGHRIRRGRPTSESGFRVAHAFRQVRAETDRSLTCEGRAQGPGPSADCATASSPCPTRSIGSQRRAGSRSARSARC